MKAKIIIPIIVMILLVGSVAAVIIDNYVPQSREDMLKGMDIWNKIKWYYYHPQSPMALVSPPPGYTCSLVSAGCQRTNTAPFSSLPYDKANCPSSMTGGCIVEKWDVNENTLCTDYSHYLGNANIAAGSSYQIPFWTIWENWGCIPITCIPNWQYSTWSTCSGGTQTRTATDSNNCGVTTGRQALSQSCTTCTENWQCGAWGECQLGNLQGRDCTDTNNCGTTTNKPDTIKSCVYIPPGCTYTSSTCPSWSTCSGNFQHCTATNCNLLTRGCGTNCAYTAFDCPSWSTCSSGFQHCTATNCDSLTKSCGTTKCTDGTALGQCSSTIPLYCPTTGGQPINKCDTCKPCPTGTTCQADGSCKISGTGQEKWEGKFIVLDVDNTKPLSTKVKPDGTVDVRIQASNIGTETGSINAEVAIYSIDAAKKLNYPGINSFLLAAVITNIPYSQVMIDPCYVAEKEFVKSIKIENLAPGDTKSFIIPATPPKATSTLGDGVTSNYNGIEKNYVMVIGEYVYCAKDNQPGHTGYCQDGTYTSPDGVVTHPVCWYLGTGATYKMFNVKLTNDLGDYHYEKWGDNCVRIDGTGASDPCGGALGKACGAGCSKNEDCASGNCFDISGLGILSGEDKRCEPSDFTKEAYDGVSDENQKKIDDGTCADAIVGSQCGEKCDPDKPYVCDLGLHCIELDPGWLTTGKDRCVPEDFTTSIFDGLSDEVKNDLKDGACPKIVPPGPTDCKLQMDLAVFSWWQRIKAILPFSTSDKQCSQTLDTKDFNDLSTRSQEMQRETLLASICVDDNNCAPLEASEDIVEQGCFNKNYIQKYTQYSFSSNLDYIWEFTNNVDAAGFCFARLKSEEQAIDICASLESLNFFKIQCGGPIVLVGLIFGGLIVIMLIMSMMGGSRQQYYALPPFKRIRPYVAGLIVSAILVYAAQNMNYISMEQKPMLVLIAILGILLGWLFESHKNKFPKTIRRHI